MVCRFGRRLSGRYLDGGLFLGQTSARADCRSNRFMLRLLGITCAVWLGLMGLAFLGPGRGRPTASALVQPVPLSGRRNSLAQTSEEYDAIPGGYASGNPPLRSVGEQHRANKLDEHQHE